MRGKSKKPVTKRDVNRAIENGTRKAIDTMLLIFTLSIIDEWVGHAKIDGHKFTVDDAIELMKRAARYDSYREAGYLSLTDLKELYEKATGATLQVGGKYEG